MLTKSNQWFISAILAAGCLILYNPITFMATEKTIGMGKGWIAKPSSGSRFMADGTLHGYVLHTIVFFFVAYAILNLPIMCT